MRCRHHKLYTGARCYHYYQTFYLSQLLVYVHRIYMIILFCILRHSANLESFFSFYTMLPHLIVSVLLQFFPDFYSEPVELSPVCSGSVLPCKLMLFPYPTSSNTPSDIHYLGLSVSCYMSFDYVVGCCLYSFLYV